MTRLVVAAEYQSTGWLFPGVYPGLYTQNIAILLHELLKPNAYANPVAASELPFREPMIGNSGSALRSIAIRDYSAFRLLFDRKHRNESCDSGGFARSQIGR